MLLLSRYELEYFFGSHYVLMKLIIKDITQEDYGEYKCYAENLQGSGENSVVLSSKTYKTLYLSDASYQVTTII